MAGLTKDLPGVHWYVIPANGAESTLKIVATDKAVPGTNYSFTVTGTGQHKDRNYKFKTGAVALVVNAPEPMEQMIS